MFELHLLFVLLEAAGEGLKMYKETEELDIEPGKKKIRLAQNFAISEKSTIFIQSS